MSSFLYNNAKSEILKGNLPWISSTLKIILLTSAYTADPDHVNVSSATSAELSGTGYTAGFGGSGRKTLASKTVTTNNTNDRSEASCSNITWTGISAGTAAAAAIIKEVTADSDSLLIAYLDFTDVVTNSGDLTLSISGSGVFFI